MTPPKKKRHLLKGESSNNGTASVEVNVNKKIKKDIATENVDHHREGHIAGNRSSKFG